MPCVFISYRRDDQPGFAGRLADVLGSAFGADNIFRDSEDIRPGEDFVDVIQAQLQGVGVMLVVIGPGWLGASRNGVRRLDEADDFVRREIQAGLASGKPVLPVLVGGAAMPAEAVLPQAIAALARRQAMVLHDVSWAADVAHLVETIRPLLPIERRTFLRHVPAWALGGIGVGALLIAVVLALPRSTPSAAPDPASAEIANTLSGRWIAQVKYDWGAVHDETFELRLENGEVHGTASYLRLPRTLEQGRFAADRLSFVTRSQETLGSTAGREVTHRYRGVIKAGELHLVLESGGGHSAHTPVEFVARRVGK